LLAFVKLCSLVVFSDLCRCAKMVNEGLNCLCVNEMMKVCCNSCGDGEWCRFTALGAIAVVVGARTVVRFPSMAAVVFPAKRCSSCRFVVAIA